MNKAEVKHCLMLDCLPVQTTLVEWHYGWERSQASGSAVYSSVDNVIVKKHLVICLKAGSKFQLNCLRGQKNHFSVRGQKNDFLFD